ncbi:MAG: protein kinase [Zavarzinella sp.]
MVGPSKSPIPSEVDFTEETVTSHEAVAGKQLLGFSPPALAGEVGTLGPYRIIKELGHGGMGAVYAALDTRLDRQIALKVMLPEYAANHAAKERFLREARAAAKIKHDNIVTIYEADERDGIPYIAMEYLEGYPLDEYLKKKGTPSLKHIIRIAAETFAGLGAAHKLGLIHRDIKPGNLWLESPNARVKILDFGLAKPMDSEVELTKSGTIVGTPAYMSPEQARADEIDHRSDLFSVGVMLYRLTTGQLPFAGKTTMAVLMALATEEPKPVRELNPEVPESLERLINQLLAKNPDQRPKDAATAIAHLREVAEELKNPGHTQPIVEAMPVTYVPMSMPTAAENPFADIDASSGSATIAQPQASEKQPEVRHGRKKAPPTGKKPFWIAAGSLAALVAMIVGVVIIIKNKDGTETKIEVPDGATVIVKGKDGKELANVGPGKVNPAPQMDVDRKAAEWVIGRRGIVQVNGELNDINSVKLLPKSPFRLTSIKLIISKLTDEDLGNIENCEHLMELNLGGNTSITDKSILRLKHIHELRTLELYYCKITNKALEHFKDCKNLQFLNIKGTLITLEGIEQLQSRSDLTILNVSNNNKIRDSDLVHLSDFKKLQELSLTGTHITDQGILHLKELKGLSGLDVSRTKITPTGIEELHQSLPKCRITHDSGVIEPIDIDRKAAEWVISKGGSVRINGQRSDIVALENLPNDSFFLTQINLPQTRVTDADLKNIWNVKHLLGLNLAHNNQLTDGIIQNLLQLKDLETLDLAGTKVTDTGVNQLKQLVNLTSLNLLKTLVSDAGSKDFKDLKRLTHLDLSDTLVSDAGVKELKSLTNLNYLNLAFTGVGDAGMQELKNLKNLKALTLEKTLVSDLGLKELKELKNLNYLSLGQTEVSDTGLKDIGLLKNLTQLHVHKTKVSDEGMKIIKVLEKLDILDLSGTQVGDLGLKELKDLKNLNHLFLKDTNLTDESLNQLKEFKKLTYLKLQNTKISQKGFADLRQALPNCKIEHDGGVIEPENGVDFHRTFAAFALSKGGTVGILSEGQFQDVAPPKMLPGGAFQVITCSLAGKKIAAHDLQHLHAVKTISTLIISDTSLDDAGFAQIGKHQTIELLYANDLPVTDVGIASIQHLPLKKLHLCSTKVTDKCASALAKMPLEELLLNSTAVTDETLVKLAKINSLKILSVPRTKVTKAGIDRFHAALPTCKITWDGGEIAAEPAKQ